MTRLVAGPVLNSSHHVYCERPEEKELYEILVNKKESVALVGAIHTGKTSLLFNIKKLLEDLDYKVAYIPLNILDPTSTEIEEHLLNTIQIALDLDEPDLDIDTFSKNNSFSSSLQILASKIYPKKLLLFLDESSHLQNMPNLCEKLLSAIEYFGAQENSGEETSPTLLMCLSGTLHPRDYLSNSVTNTRTIINNLKIVRVGNIARENIHPIINALISSGISDEDSMDWVDEIWRWTSGHPYFTQRMALFAVEEVRKLTLSSAQEKKEVLLLRSEELSGKDVPRDRTFDAIERTIIKQEQTVLIEALVTYMNLFECKLRYDESNIGHRALLESGLADFKRSDGNAYLVQSCNIIGFVFDVPWCKSILAKFDRPYISDLERYLRDGDRSLPSEKNLVQTIERIEKYKDSLAPIETEFLYSLQKELERQARRRLLNIAIKVIVILLIFALYLFYRVNMASEESEELTKAHEQLIQIEKQKEEKINNILSYSGNLEDDVLIEKANEKKEQLEAFLKDSSISNEENRIIIEGIRGTIEELQERIKHFSKQKESIREMMNRQTTSTSDEVAFLTVSLCNEYTNVRKNLEACRENRTKELSELEDKLLTKSRKTRDSLAVERREKDEYMSKFENAKNTGELYQRKIGICNDNLRTCKSSLSACSKRRDFWEKSSERYEAKYMRCRRR